MKRIFALLLSICLLASFSVTAFAEYYSPSGSVVFKYEYEIVGNGSVDKIALEDGSYKFVAIPDEGENFTGWNIIGKDYLIVSGTLNSTEIVILAKSDVKLIANFTSLTDADKPSGDASKDESEDSPQTGDSTMVVIPLILLAAAATVVAFKKAVK